MYISIHELMNEVSFEKEAVVDFQGDLSSSSEGTRCLPQHQGERCCLG